MDALMNSIPRGKRDEVSIILTADFIDREQKFDMLKDIIKDQGLLTKILEFIKQGPAETPFLDLVVDGMEKNVMKSLLESGDFENLERIMQREGEEVQEAYGEWKKKNHVEVSDDFLAAVRGLDLQKTAAAEVRLVEDDEEEEELAFTAPHIRVTMALMARPLVDVIKRNMAEKKELAQKIDEVLASTMNVSSGDEDSNPESGVEEYTKKVDELDRELNRIARYMAEFAVYTHVVEERPFDPFAYWMEMSISDDKKARREMGVDEMVKDFQKNHEQAVERVIDELKAGRRSVATILQIKTMITWLRQLGECDEVVKSIIVRVRAGEEIDSDEDDVPPAD